MKSQIYRAMALLVALVGHVLDGRTIERCQVTPPAVGMTKVLLEVVTFIGLGAGEVRDLPSAGDRVRRLWQEYQCT